MIGSLFSGVGLLDLGLERAGLGAPAWQVELNPYRRQVLARHWPAAERFPDVRTFRPLDDAACPRPRVVCGGFPCQPHSVAGARRGADDERHLWPALARILAEVEPAIFIGENVPGLRTTALRDVLADLTSLGFDAEWTCFSAGSIGAPHRRDRWWIAAPHPDRVDVRLEPGWLGRAIRAAQESQLGRDREVGASNAAALRRPIVGRRTEEDGRTLALGGGEDLESANPDGEGRVQHAVRIAEERGWARYCGWGLDLAARMDDGGAEGLDEPWGADADELRHIGERKAALGDGVVVACAELVGRAVMEAIAA